MLGLLQRLAGLAIDIRAKAAERAEAEAAKLRAGDGANVDPVFADPAALDRRLGAMFYRLVGLMARIQMRASSARGAARANAPGALGKRQAAARTRAEAKAAFVRQTNLDPRYMPLKRPLGQEPPARRSAVWRYLEGLAETIAGSDDRAVVAETCAEFAAMARRLGAEKTAEAVEALGRAALAEMDGAPVPDAPGCQPRGWETGAEEADTPPEPRPSG
ncbi:MAG: hypothetical protein JSR21_14580 [Proteobacteria bacterium]|nr:hypothetical protein [Pseudomonadota bacterium]